jgi:cytochrome c oxidase subunit II
LRAVIIGVVGAVLGCLLGIAVVAAGTMPEQASKQAENTDWVYDIMVIITGGIFGLVTAVLVAAIVLFRHRRGETRTAPPVHGHTGLEIWWTIIPAVIVIFFTAISWKALNDNEGGKADMAITVWGQQFDWKYDYPELGLEQQSELVVPVDTKIDFTVQTKDVIHGFWVPAWRVQINATPGQETALRVTPTKTGSFKVVCTFICGSGHPVMGTDVKGSIPRHVRVVTRAEWDAWAEEAKAAAAEAAASPEGAAVAVFTKAGCGGCHAWSPAGSAGGVGPSLDGLAGGDAEAVRASIVDPGATLVSGFGDIMPKDYGSSITPEDLDLLVQSLAGGGA